MRCYIAGPMRGHRQWNWDAFDSAAAWLRRAGWEVISPAEHDRETGLDQHPGFELGEKIPNDDPTFHALIGWDLQQIATPGNVDAIVLLPGWEESSGTAMELQVARWTGKRVFYLHLIQGGYGFNNTWRIEEEQAPVVLGLMGYAQSGKDTVGGFLVEHHGFERIAFADALRDMLYALNPLVHRGLEGRNEADTVQALVDEIGWEGAKASGFPSSSFRTRDYLQRLGTEAGRQVLGDDIWVRTALAKIKPGGRYVITDCRFPNEADAIRALGGELWRVVRPGTTPVNAHPSETALDGYPYDAKLNNNGPLPQLRSLVYSQAGRLLARSKVGA